MEIELELKKSITCPIELGLTVWTAWCFERDMSRCSEMSLCRETQNVNIETFVLKAPHLGHVYLIMMLNFVQQPSFDFENSLGLGDLIFLCRSLEFSQDNFVS